MNKRHSTKLTCLIRYKLRGVQDVIAEYRPGHGWYVCSPHWSEELLPVWIGAVWSDAFNYIYYLPNDPSLALLWLLLDSLADFGNNETKVGCAI